MSDKERAEQALRAAGFQYDDRHIVWRRGNMDEATYAEVDIDHPRAASMYFPIAELPALLAPLAPPTTKADPMSTPQQALVSLADGPARLRLVREHLSGIYRFWPNEWMDKTSLKADMDTLDAIASSLEQLHQSEELSKPAREALEWAIQTLGDCNASDELKAILQTPPVANACSNQGDTVTITLSREDAHKLWMGAEGLRHLEAGEALNTYECGDPDAWSRIAGVAYRAYGAALNNSTPERRE